MPLLLLLCEWYAERLFPIYVLSRPLHTVTPPPTPIPNPSPASFQQLKIWLMEELTFNYLFCLPCGSVIFTLKVWIEDITNFQWLFGTLFFFVCEVLSPLSQAFFLLWMTYLMIEHTCSFGFIWGLMHLSRWCKLQVHLLDFEPSSGLSKPYKSLGFVPASWTVNVVHILIFIVTWFIIQWCYFYN